jgi:hypothetical protein
MALPENPISGKLVPATRIASRNRSDRAEKKFGKNIAPVSALTYQRPAPGVEKRPPGPRAGRFKLTYDFIVLGRLRWPVEPRPIPVVIGMLFGTQFLCRLPNIEHHRHARLRIECAGSLPVTSTYSPSQTWIHCLAPCVPGLPECFCPRRRRRRFSQFVFTAKEGHHDSLD